MGDVVCEVAAADLHVSMAEGLWGLHFGYIVDICRKNSKIIMADETRNERFRRLAATRGDRLIREISLLGNLANRKNYDYPPEEVDELFRPIEVELQEVRALFDPAAPSNRKVSFK